MLNPIPLQLLTPARGSGRALCQAAPWALGGHSADCIYQALMNPTNVTLTHPVALFQRACVSVGGVDGYCRKAASPRERMSDSSSALNPGPSRPSAQRSVIAPQGKPRPHKTLASPAACPLICLCLNPAPPLTPHPPQPTPPPTPPHPPPTPPNPPATPHHPHSASHAPPATNTAPPNTPRP